MSGLLFLVGLVVFCTSVIAVLRGHLNWARLPSRRRASGAALVGLALLVAGVVLGPSKQPVALNTSSPASIATASTSPSPTNTAADQAAAAKAAADQATAAKAAADQATAAKAAADQATAAKAAADQATAAKAAADQATAAKAAADQATAAKAAADQAAASTAVAPPPPPPAPTAQVFANCTDMHAVYPHGVGRPGAVDQVRSSTRPVTNFFVSEELYNANSFSDADGDGIACEKK